MFGSPLFIISGPVIRRTTKNIDSVAARTLLIEILKIIKLYEVLLPSNEHFFQVLPEQ